MNPILQELQNKQWVWNAANAKHAISAPKLSCGYADLDAVLSGGFPPAGMIHVDSTLGCGELRLMLSMLQNAKQNKSTQSAQHKLYVFINAPFNINAEFLAAHNIALSQVIIIETRAHKTTKKPSIQDAEALWSAEQCVKSGACAAVFIWQHQLSHSQIKKLELGAQHGNSYCVWLQTQNTLAKPNNSNLPLSLSVSLLRENNDLLVKVNKQKVGWAHKSVKVPLPFRSATKASMGAYLAKHESSKNVIAIGQNTSYTQE